MNSHGHIQPFDALAADYDRTFTDRLPAQTLRALVRERVASLLPGNARIFEVGCGTGQDALWFAGEGHTVLATDVSAPMLEATRNKLADASPDLRDRVTTAHFDAARPAESKLQLPDSLDLVFSNFGALNCVPDVAPLLSFVHDHVRPGGHAALCVMGRFCAWETFGFALRGDARRMARRWRGESRWTVDGRTHTVWYPTVGALKRAGRPGFRPVATIGIGALLPTSEFFGAWERRPRLFAALARAERRIAASWPANRVADHCLVIFRKAQQDGTAPR